MATSDGPERAGAERTLSWRELTAEVVDRLRAAGLERPEHDARRIAEQASGRDGAEWVLGVDDPVTRREVAHVDAMSARRARGEPLQYVVGRWGFRSLDLFVDDRVLIPRPETETVVDEALAAVEGLAGAGRPLVVADLGTGSGAIALSLAVELPGAEVWAVERSPGALEVARANLAGLGRAATRVRLLEGSWFAGLPDDLRGRLDLVVANPPYVAEGDLLAPEVADWEPREALVSGPTGVEDLAVIIAEAPQWLTRPGVLVCELAPTQADEVVALARGAGFADAEVRPDLSGRLRTLVARH